MEEPGKGNVPGPDVSVRMFQSDALEALTHMHPATPWFIGVPTALAMLYWAFAIHAIHPLLFLGLAAAGLLAWTLLEYVMHRFVFHYEPRTAWGRKVHFVIHGVHHDYPNDATRLVMPPVLSIPLGLGALGALYLSLGAPITPAIFIGITTGYIGYDTVHFMTHHRPMRGPLGRALKRYHMRHHFSETHSGYGVSSPLWDHVFRTHPSHVEARAAKRKPHRKPSDR
jgi:sterol desaturase/sphingolipid hydroxylase (fatty acid hydroxylase superfamily)